MKLYLDTNIFLNFFFDEMNGLRDAGYYSRQLLEQAMDCKFRLIISSYTEFELLNRYPFMDESLEKHKRTLRSMGKLSIVNTTYKDKQSARELTKKLKSEGAHFADMVHVVHTMNHADVLVTRDKKLHDCCEGLVDSAFPEEPI